MNEHEFESASYGFPSVSIYVIDSTMQTQQLSTDERQL